jgi:putative ABC transport system permease protein
VVGQQTEYVRNKKLGYDKEQVMIVVANKDEIRKNREQFKDQLRQNTQIKYVSGMSGEPGGFHDRYAFEVEDHKGETPDLRTVFTDHDYVKTLGLKIVAGRDFSRDFTTDAQEAVLINEAAARYLGWELEEALGKEITNKFRDSIPHKVVGVIEDFHFASLHTSIDPMIISMSDDQRVFAIKLASGNVQQAVALVEDAWQKAAEQYPFAYSFLDEEYDNLYKAEQKQGMLFRLFAGLAIFIACLGLFGLVTYTAEQRTKEIGIRKVLGASVPGLVHLLSKEFTLLVLVALVAAIPVAWWAMEQWLSNFAYRIDIGVGIFIIAGLIALAIAWLTVSYQSIKAAMANPIESLKNE